MVDIKCPFCQQELDTGNYYVHCHNPNCNTTVEMEGTEELWAALIRTRKALDKAKSVLKSLLDYADLDGIQEWEVEETIKQITTLEQKDVK